MSSGADILAQLLEGRESHKYHMMFRKKALQHFSLKVLDVNQILKTIHHEVNKAVESFGLESWPAKSVEYVLYEANIQLSLLLLNLSYEEKNSRRLSNNSCS